MQSSTNRDKWYKTLLFLNILSMKREFNTLLNLWNLLCLNSGAEPRGGEGGTCPLLLLKSLMVMCIYVPFLNTLPNIGKKKKLICLVKEKQAWHPKIKRGKTS